LNATLRRSRLLVAVAGLALVLAACGSSSGGGGGGGASGTIDGGGSSFQKNFDEAVIAAYGETNSDATVNYAASSSGTGKSALQTETIDWAGSDSLPKPDELSSYQGGALLYFPTVAAPITVSYNLPGVETLKLSQDTLAKIFALKIKKWNDSAIAQDNPGVDLPSTSITVARRADASGTTSNFPKFLEAVDPTDWTLGHGDTVDWASLPGTTQAGTKNGGVAQIIKDTEGAIGYVDLADATGSELQTAEIENSAGKFVAPTVEGAAAAVAGAEVKDDLSYDPINAAGEGAYPITSPTWILAYEKQTDAAKGTLLKDFLTFVYADGQGLANDAGYAQLPASLVEKAQAQLDKLQIPS
jgi:phosphate transport system substrate-binding protein